MEWLGDGGDPGHFQGRGRSTWGREMGLAWGVLSAGRGQAAGSGERLGGSHQDHFLLQLLQFSLLFLLHFSSLPHFKPPFRPCAWVPLVRGHGPLLPPAPHCPP